MRHAQCYIVKAPPLMVRLFKAGSLVINSPGTRHAVVSDEGWHPTRNLRKTSALLRQWLVSPQSDRNLLQLDSWNYQKGAAEP